MLHKNTMSQMDINGNVTRELFKIYTHLFRNYILYLYIKVLFYFLTSFSFFFYFSKNLKSGIILLHYFSISDIHRRNSLFLEKIYILAPNYSMIIILSNISSKL